MIRLLFRCGHRGTSDGTGTPVCPVCGDRQVARATCPPPRITGWASGPYVTPDRTAPPASVTLAQEPLRLKETH